MPLSTDMTTAIVADHQRSANDTGSPEVQISLLSKRILVLTEHLKCHKKDNISAHSLALLVSKRRRLLRYLQNISAPRYRGLIQRLGLRG
jgi:small subunit ribosomal protein S15